MATTMGASSPHTGHHGTVTHRIGSAEAMPAFELLADRIGPDKAALVATKLMVCDADDFHKHDADRSGQISKWEFTAMFRTALFIRKRELSDADIDHIWATMDNDRSGSITLTEFLEFATGGVSKGGKDEKTRAMHGAQLTLEAAALHKSGKLEDCIPVYLESLKYTVNRRARFVTLNNLANAFVSRAIQDPKDKTSLRANALTMWREALKIDEGEGDRSQVAFNAGELLLENGELAECIKMYKIVLDVGGHTAYGSKANVKLGIAMRELGLRKRMDSIGK